ncbi:hypothetical protein NW762_008097 [Fusarium torreyae]|uniref:ATP-citrate synthase/succinyl-CoA ligase C-terminal domain-containing protein n=1 Tax=Fusarium torreyae TaxID=1237075 RepID=A0A9W8VFB5_9HYPO|nr:hypothetical protein NW762_008097 [Fusarium torreyae]
MPLIVAIAEYIPVHDMLRVREMLRAQKASRLVGPNCPGIITPGKYRIGIIPIEQCTQGTVDIVSRSSTMIYEASGATARAGPGQSLVIGLGGDMMPGTTMQEALDTLLTHDQSEAIILIGEIGVTSELDAANAIRRYRKTTVNPKPIISKRVPAGKDMGHTGALLSPSEQGAEAKALALEEAGAIVVPHLGMLDGTPQTLFL